MSPHVRPLVGWKVVPSSVGWLVSRFVSRLIGQFFCWSVIISEKGGKLHFHAPIGALVIYFWFQLSKLSARFKRVRRLIKKGRNFHFIYIVIFKLRTSLQYKNTIRNYDAGGVFALPPQVSRGAKSRSRSAIAPPKSTPLHAPVYRPVLPSIVQQSYCLSFRVL